MMLELIREAEKHARRAELLAKAALVVGGVTFALNVANIIILIAR